MTEVEQDHRPVIGGKLVYTSHSASTRAAGCETSYFFRYNQGIPDPPGAAALKGTAGHKRMEHHLLTGEEVLGPLESAGRKWIPLPLRNPGSSEIVRPGLTVEGKVDGILDGDGVPFRGGMDLLNERNDAHATGLAVVTDWKFKSEIACSGGVGHDEWKCEKCKAFRDGLINPDNDEGRQMLAYSETYFRMRPDARAVVARHVHFGTRRKEAGMWEALVTREYAAKAWVYIVEKYVKPLHRIAAATSPEQLEQNTENCYRWHKPCVYMADHCPIDPVELMLLERPSREKGPMGPKENNMGLLSNMMSGLDSPTEALPPVAAPEPSKLSTPPPPPFCGVCGEAQTFANTIRNGEIVTHVKCPKAAAPSPSRILDIGAAYKLPDGSVGRLELLEGSNAQVLTSPTERVTLPIKFLGEMVSPAVALVQAPDAPLKPPSAESTPEAAPIAASEPEAPKRGRGRPKKAEPTAPDADKQGDQLVSEARPEGRKVVADSEPNRTKAEGAAIGVHLYFTGAPLGVATSSLFAYTEQLERKILEKFQEGKVPDIRLARAEQLGFGRWKAVLGQVAKENPPPGGHYLVGQEEKELVVAQALIPVASLVVMGR
jgi:hypothetical protein